MILVYNNENSVLHKSDCNKYIRQVETGNIYSEAFDVLPCRYTYEETDIEIEETRDDECGVVFSNDKSEESKTTINELNTDTITNGKSINIVLERLQNQKINEMSIECNKTITNGKDITLSNGSTYHFSFTIEDQVSIARLYDKVKNNEYFLPYHYDGGETTVFSKDDIVTLNIEMESFIIYHQAYFNSLKNYIKSMPYYQLDGVYYGMPILEEYQSDVLKKLNS